MLSTVVQLGILVTLDLDNDSLLVRGHLEDALGSGDGVVVGVGTLVQSVAELVVTLAHRGLRAGDAVGRTLALDKALAGDGDLIVGQSRAVEHLGVGSRDQGDGTGANRKKARLGGNGKLFGHVVTRRVSHLSSTGDKVDMLAGIRAFDLGGQTGDGVCDAVDWELSSHKARGGVLLTVVGGGVRNSLDFNRVLRVTVGNGQCARVLR